jgi:hypothetical protein
MIRSVVVSFAGTAADRIMTGSIVSVSAAENSLASQLNAQALDEHGLPLSPQPSFVWRSSNPGAVTVTPTDGTGSAANVTRKQSGVNNTLQSFNSNGVPVATGEVACLGGLTTVEAEALRPDGSLSGIIGTLKAVAQNAGYGKPRSNGGGYFGGTGPYVVAEIRRVFLHLQIYWGTDRVNCEHHRN